MQTLVKTVARDENCDLYLDDKGNLAMVEGLDAYAQIINAKMRTSLGELQLSMQKGVPYFQTIFGDKSMLPIWEKEVANMVNDLYFVKKIKSFSCNFDEDMLQYSLEIETDLGSVVTYG